MNIKFPEGKNLFFKSGNEAIDFLYSTKIKDIEIEPERLKLSLYKNVLILEIFTDKIFQFPVRESFFFKLLKWFGFPYRQLQYLDNETVASICNDYLMNIKSTKVNVKIEDNEALTIISDKFSEVSDIELIQKVANFGINKIFIDDYNTNIIVEEKSKIAPFPNDVFGIGLSITNSETGFSSVNFKDFLFRYICSNGAYIQEHNEINKFYHYNLFVPDVFARLDNSLNELNKRAKEIEAKLRKMEVPINKYDVFHINKEIFKNTAIKLLNDLIDEDRSLTKYELMNIITERAKELPFGLRTKVETIAGYLINSVN